MQLAKQLTDIRFVLVGSETEDNISDNVVNIGKIENQDMLGAYYQMADLCVICSKRETFSMVCAESLCSGTPVVGFKAGGPESISLEEYSEFCEYGDIDGLVELVKKWINVKMDNDLASLIQQEAAMKYDDNLMSKKYLKVYDDLVKNHGGGIED